MPTPVVVIKPVALAAVDDLRIARNKRDPGLGTRLSHRAGNALELDNRQALFEDERRCQIKRCGTADGQVVNRAVHRQFADIATGEKAWAHHE